MMQRITLDAKRITPYLFTKNGECSEPRALFAKLFPDEVEVTEEPCIRYVKQFDFDWT